MGNHSSAVIGVERYYPIFSNVSRTFSSRNETINIEYQRERAKEMTYYFNNMDRDRRIQESKILGWSLKNEIINGRWVMMGLAIGLLTEFSTGVNFIEQLEFTVSYMGIADMADYF